MNILWDFDGTLFDTYPSLAKTFLQILQREDLTIEEILPRLHQSSRATFQYYSLNEEHYQQFVELEKKVPPEETPPFPYVQEVVKLAKTNLIVTFKSREAVEKILAHYQMREYFQEIITPEDGLPPKPDPTAYQMLHDTYGIDLCIGDREKDLLPAQALGVPTCAFRAFELHADYHIADYADFPVVLLAMKYRIKPGTSPTPELTPSFLEQYFSPNEKRLSHILGVVRKAKGLPEAYLHDIGYSPKLVRTGFHPLDGALFAIEHGFSPAIVKTILFHSAAYGEAVLRGGEIREIYEQLIRFLTEEDQKRIDFISYCDLCTSPTGKEISIAERIREVLARYPEDSVVHQNILRNQKYFFQLMKTFE